MSIVICALKLMELVWNLSIGRIHSGDMTMVTDVECISVIIFTIIIVIPITWMICKKTKSNRDYIASSLILMCYTFLWIGISYGTFISDYPSNLSITRYYSLAATLVTTIFCITKGNEMLLKDDNDIRGTNGI